MKKIIFSLILVSFLVGASFAFAQDQNLPSPGITPDSSLYFLKEWKEKIQLFLTLNAENKAKQYLHLAEVRLAEYQKMIEKGKTEIAEKTLEKYENQLNRAVEKIEKMKQKGKDVKDISQKLEDKIAKHTEVLEKNLQKVPEAGKKGIEKALDESSKVLEKIKGTKDDKSNLIEVFTPKPNKVIKSPLSIEGKVKGTWFFEGSFPIKLLDGDGKEIAVVLAQPQSDWMTTNFVNFKAKLEFQKPQTEKGILVFEKDNPSGLPEKADEFRVSVVFEDTSSDETSKWKTYRNEEQGFKFKYPEKTGISYINFVSVPEGWPPKMTVAAANSNFVCEENPNIKTEIGYGSREKLTIGNNTYCLTEASSAAAGTRFMTYKYLTERNGKLITLTFVSGYPTCSNIAEDNEMKKCEKEQKNFDPGVLADKIISTLKFIK